MPPKIAKRPRSVGVRRAKRAKKALVPIQQLPDEIQGYIALFLTYPEEVVMHFFWPVKSLHTPWYMERRVPEIMRSVFMFDWRPPPDAEERLKIYMENIKTFPIRLVNRGEVGSVFLLRNGRWGRSNFSGFRLSWTP